MTQDKLLPVEQVELCPWGCKPKLTTKSVPGPEPTFPDRKRPVICCEHAHMEGDRRLVIGSDDWTKLIERWNTRHRLRTAPAAGVERVVAAASDAIGACQLALADGRSADRKRFASDWLETAKGRVAKAIEAALATKGDEA